MRNPTIESLELHISPYLELSQSMRKRIKRAGGEYSACRGTCSTRYVSLPATAEDVANALVLANTSRNPVAMIARGRSVGRYNAAWVVVHKYQPGCGETPVDFLHRSVTEAQANYDQRFPNTQPVHA